MLCERYKYTPEQVYDLTFSQYAALVEAMNDANK